MIGGAGISCVLPWSGARLNDAETQIIHTNVRQDMRNGVAPPRTVEMQQATITRRLSSQCAWFALAAALAMRVAAAIWMPLIPEEAYYWNYAKHPALSYFDHPPMVAWVIGAGTWLLGDTEAGVRLLAMLLMIGSSVLIYHLGRMWFTRRVGLWSAALMQALPIYFGVGLIATMDGALVFWWLTALVAVSVALRRNNGWAWWVAGAAIGAAMLTKYTGAFLGLGCALAVLGRREWRRHLATTHPYIGALIAAAAFSPVLIWNSQHQWASFSFQFEDRWEASGIGLWHVVAFLGMQAAVLTPVLMVAAVMLVTWLVRRPRRLLSGRWWFALCFSIPCLAVMAWQGLRYSIHINWTLPAMVSLIPATCAWMFARDRKAYITKAHGATAEQTGEEAATIATGAGAPGLFRRWWTKVTWTRSMKVTVGVVGGGSVLALAYLLLLEPTVRRVPAVSRWPDLGAAVAAIRSLEEQRSGKELFILADGRYRLASVVAFYGEPSSVPGRASADVTSQWPLGGTGLAYAFWSQKADYIGRDCLYVDELAEDPRLSAERIETLKRFFLSVEMIGHPMLTELKTYRVALCRYYLGKQVPISGSSTGEPPSDHRP